MNRDKNSRVVFSKALKLRLLEALRAGVIDMADFPELQQAQEAVEVDISMLTEEEQTMLVEVARKLRQ